MIARDGMFAMAMDFSAQGEALGGWIGLDREASCRAWISTPRGELQKLDLNVSRPDVVAAGHSNIVLCGFDLPTGLNCREGDFVRIFIDSDDGVNRSHSWLIGNHSHAFSTFDNLQFPRDEFQICSVPTKSLIDTMSSTELLKCLIIRLRRGSRGLTHSSRGGFIPYDYEFSAEDLAVLKDLIYNYSFATLDLLKPSTRYLFSLNDTLSDWSQGIERFASLYVGSFMMWERSAQTILKSEGSFFDLPALKNKPGQSLAWGQMLTHQLSSDDALDVFLARSWELIHESKMWLHHELLLRIFEHPGSLHSMILGASDYFEESWGIYRMRILEVRDQLMWSA